MRLRALLLVAPLVLAGVACGDIGVRVTQRQAGVTPNESPSGTDPSGTDPAVEPTYEVVDGIVDFGEDGPQHPEYDGFLTAAFQDIQQFWSDEFPATYGSPWEPLEGGIYAAYPGRRSKIPGCGTPESTYEDVQMGTAFYCIVGDFMAYDDADGLPALVEQLGKEAVGVVLAHEFGHAIQARADEWDQPGVLKEQQADCFAGAWTAHVASGASDLIRFDDADVRSGLVAMINVRDPIEAGGLSTDDAHGTGFDRVGAFQDGFEGGAARCRTFFTEGRLDKLVDIPFEFRDPNQGNLPLIDPDPDPTNGPSDIITLIPGSLRFFWTDLAEQNGVPFTAPELSPFPTDGPYPSCEGIADTAWKGNAVFCPGDNTIHWDDDVFAALAADPLTGDMSVGYLLSNAYSDAIQYALRSNRQGESRALFSDCLTGAWVGYIVPPIPQDRTDQLVLSAGDLDEAIITAIDRSDASTDTDVLGSAFEKVDAFRTGVLGGLNVCRSAIP
ncbi:MAG: hypothetical protein RI900_3359 [Actinomycetota bacterium]